MKIRIITRSGAPHDGIVTNEETGEVVEGITSLRIKILPNKPPEAILTFKNFGLDVVANVKEDKK